jgi:hypothetical protein
MSIASYNPLVPPPAAEWLALDESARVALVEAWHDRHAADPASGDRGYFSALAGLNARTWRRRF